MKKLLYVLVLIVVLAFATGCESDVSAEKDIEIENVGDKGGSIVEETDEPQDPVEIEEAEEPAEEVEKFKVTHVRDGDTFEIDYHGTVEAVRLIGIDTPESVHADASRNTEEGKIASDFTKELLKDNYVSLEFDVEERDQYGRLLAYAYVDGEMLNKVLLMEGYAQVATYPPNVKYVDDFTQLQKVARENGVGLWGESVSEDTSSRGESADVTLIGSINSDKYHIKGYTHNGQIAEHNIVVFDSVEDAAARGYVPCKACFN